jgi:hypothetical protein
MQGPTNLHYLKCCGAHAMTVVGPFPAAELRGRRRQVLSSDRTPWPVPRSAAAATRSMWGPRSGLTVAAAQ